MTDQISSTTVTIRMATAKDIHVLAEFIKPFVAEGRLLDRTLAEFEDLLPHFFVAEMEGQIVGCAALEIYSRKLAEIRSLAVSPTVQGMGVGKQLVQACVERARRHNIYEVMAITSSEGFFVNCGFDFTLPGEKKALFYQTRDEF
ncbi:MAG: GNAT family N-acetyltransferase [Anaerolineae bacterium]